MSATRESCPLSVGVAAIVKEKLDIVELIGETVQLRKAGTTCKGLCPFHGEKTPSFTVTPARETWKCFGCGRGGDIFNFVMERDGVDFATALRSLAGRAGVELSERTTREDAERKRLRDALEAADRVLSPGADRPPAGRPGASTTCTVAASPTRPISTLPARVRARRLGRAHDAPSGAARGIAEARPRARGPRRADAAAVAASTTASAAASSSPSATRHGGATGLAGRILGPRHGRVRAQVPELPADAAVRQEPHALPHRPRQDRHPQGRPRRPRRGQHGRADGPPGGLRRTSCAAWARRSRPARSSCSRATRRASRSRTTSTPPARARPRSARPS